MSSALLIKAAAAAICVLGFAAFYLAVHLLLKKKQPDTKWVIICPKCASVNVRSMFLAEDRNPLFIWNHFNQHRYKCNDCGFEGVFPEADTALLDDVRKRIRKSK